MIKIWCTHNVSYGNLREIGIANQDKLFSKHIGKTWTKGYEIWKEVRGEERKRICRQI